MAVAFVLTASGNFGGAQRRFANLFLWINKNKKQNVYFFISEYYYQQIKELYSSYPFENVFVIDNRIKYRNRNKTLKTLKTTNIEDDKAHYKKHKELSFIHKTWKFYKNLYINYRVYLNIRKLEKKLKITSFIAVYNSIIPLYFYLKKNKKRNIAFVNMDSWFSAIHPINKKFWYLKYATFNYALNRVPVIDFLSPFICHGLKNKGFDFRNSQIHFTPGSFTNYEMCKQGSKKPFSIAFAGRLEPDKNPLMLLEAIKILNEQDIQIPCYILGRGNLETTIKEKIKQNKLNNVMLMGFHKNPPEILQSTSIFVSLQSTNNYPSQSVLEAMACGNAIIATNVGDTSLFVNTQNGILINRNPNELANAIKYLYLNDIELEKRIKYSYDYVRNNHTVDKIADYYLRLFN